MTQIGDSAYPLAASAYPPGVAGWGFYIGGDTPHVWTNAEIAALPYRYRLPIYTRSDPAGSAQAQQDAQIAVAWAKAHGQPAGTLIQLDFETAVDAAYVQAFDQVIVAAGFKTVLYGSQSTVLQNPAPSGGYNVANWDGVDDDPSWTAKQYADTGGYDLNDFAPTAPLWDTQAPVAPGAAAADPEDTMRILYVQGTQTVWGHDGLCLWPIADTQSLGSYQQATPNPVTKVQTITQDELARIQAAIKNETPPSQITVGLAGEISGTVTPPPAS